MATVFLSDLTARDVACLDKSRCVVFLTVSPIEQHAHHLPLSTDICEANGLREIVIDRLAGDLPDWTCVVHPDLPIGAGCLWGPGTVDVRPELVRGVVEDIAVSLGRSGFQWLLLLSHHGAPAHNLAPGAAARSAARRGSIRVLSLAGRTILELYLQGGLDPFLRARGYTQEERHALRHDLHAAAFETSEMLVFRPDLVREGYQSLPPVVVRPERISPSAALRAGRGLGYFGAPGLASRELGVAFLAFVTDKLYPQILAFLRGQRVPGLPAKWRALLQTLHWVHVVRERAENVVASPRKGW
jgi:creatinine amidohydrolase